MEVAVPFLLNNVPAFKFFTRRYVLSNHFVHTFTMDFDGYGHIHVMSSEHCYFLMKAAHFGDMASFHRIRQAQTPASAKQLGRRIMPFVEEVWHAVRFGIMCRELRAKFNVEPMRSALLTTGNGQLVEASLDEFWAARREVLALIREEVRPLPPTPNHLVRHYLVAQASAEDYVIAAAVFEHEPLTCTCSLALPSVTSLSSSGTIGMQRLNASHSMVIQLCRGGFIKAKLHVDHLQVCSVNVLVYGRVHTMTQRNMTTNILHLQEGQKVQLHVKEVPAALKNSKKSSYAQRSGSEPIDKW
ncbi:hypothetical protein niasHT_010107 [Heterodera trifolii]|uniref:NADAR domain-containing protein n=1 Tax=Heterodera trifolii TaxID=157864 RepID=A0ABD2LWC4_9BILA